MNHNAPLSRRRRRSDRRGITLLFVISMIVLFLLLGTTFVVVSNDFYRASRTRSISQIHYDNGPALVQQAARLAIRGPALTNLNSPLRCVDLLSDQYGYGIKSFVAADPVPAFTSVVPGEQQFIQIALSADPAVVGTDASAFSLAYPELGAAPIPEIDHLYDGNVLTFTTGPAKGISARIFEHVVDKTGATTVHLITIPSVYWNDAGTILLTDLPGSEIIINGADFAGGISGGTGELLFPNRRGEPLTSLRANFMLDDPDNDAGFVPTSRATNEPWDAADSLNVFLSGFDRDGNLIPSFFRGVANGFSPGTTSPAGAAEAFHAFDINPDVDSDQDGTLDAYWLDVGFNVQTNGQGLYYKPLVAYHIVDLDGRVNLNAHGNLSQVLPNRFINTFVGTSAPSVMPPGQGYGPAEVELATVFQTTTGTLTPAGVLNNVLSARYAGVTNDGFPGLGTAVRTRVKLFGHPFDVVDWSNGNFGTRGNKFASSPMDIAGRFRIVAPTLAQVIAANPADNFIDRNYNNFPSGLPVIDMLESADTMTPELQISPYEMSFASSPYNDPNDSPFTELELERLLRPFDADSALLPSRLWNIAEPTNPATSPLFWLTDVIPNRNQLVTTRSFEVPVTYGSIVRRARARIAAELGITLPTTVPAELNAIRNLTEFYFAPELLAKLKMDINRPFGDGYDNNGNGIVDDPAEATGEVNTDQGGVPMDLDNDGVANNPSDANARINYARHLYMLMLLLTDDPQVDLDGGGYSAATDGVLYRQNVAQWAVNVVDFRDADSIMTRFQYDTNPWDGWTPNAEVWGCERPELLLSESLAAHARRTEETASPGVWEQRLRPEAFAYFELYNPWTQNSLNQYQDASMYDGATQGVDLGRVNPGASPVWRFAIERPERGATAAAVVRYVYMTNPDAAAAVGDDDAPNVEVFYPSMAAGTLRPGAQAVVGTLGFEDPGAAGEYLSFFGRLNSKTVADEAGGTLDLNMTHHIRINPGSGEVRRFPADPVNDPRFATIVPIDQGRTGAAATGAPRTFSLSDPLGGYTMVDSNGDPIVDITDGDGAYYMQPWTTPLDDATTANPAGNRNADDLALINVADGMSKDFRVVRLQRLANPGLPWDANANPYMTIDSLEVDLISFNGVSSAAGQPGIAGGSDPDKAISLEQGSAARVAFGHQRNAAIGAGGLPSATHFFGTTPVESLGKTNDSFNPAGGVNSLAWLTWNNRPFANQMELMLVPFAPSDRLTYTPEGQNRVDVGINNGLVDPYDNLQAANFSPLSGRFSHLFNFFARDAGATNDRPDFYRILEYTEVPSRFIGTDALLSVSSQAQNPFNRLARYRVPGKINLNTIPPDPGSGGTSSQVWASTASNFAATATWNQLRNSLMATGAPVGSAVKANPFRHSEAADMVQPGATGATFVGSETNLLRPQLTATDTPLLDYNNASTTHDASRNAYFHNAMRQRLANMTTTRSSVFAIWVTIGYFQTDSNGAFLDANGVLLPAGVDGVEIGSQTGEVKRHRGFYIYDRSIPVGFEPGRNHNIDRGFLVESIIE